MEQTDDELWQSYNSGNQEGFEALFHRHKGKVFNFALRMLASRADAEDVTSETFLQLFNRRYQADSRAKLSTWLFTVARNNCLTRLRSAKYSLSMWFKSDDAGVYEERQVEDDRDLPAEALSKKEAARAVRQAINRLPVEQKEALILREYSGKEYAEIAEILECSLEKVKVLIFRGRERLREELAPIIKGDGQ